jgi:glycosyltransferase involved in cell wall biosynthesis
MKIAIVGTSPGNSYGGTEVLLEKLIEVLEFAEHDVKAIYLEAKFGNPNEIIESVGSFENLDLSAFDVVIALRFPAYYVKHPRKIVWLLHQFRPLGDMYETEFGFGYSIENLNTRNQLRKMDQISLGQLGNRLRVNSHITSKRLLISTGIQSKVQMCPLSQDLSQNLEKVCPPELSEFKHQYIFMGGRISTEKRALLALQAAQETGAGLIIAGSVEDDAYLSHLLRSVKSKKVVVIGRRVSTAELRWLYQNSSGVAYIPKGEDSYGFVLGEAASFGKMLVTCEDSGDTVPFVREMQGYISHPNVDSLAKAFSQVLTVRAESDEIIDAWEKFKPQWKHVVEWIESCGV